MFEFRRIETAQTALDAYANLFRACFPTASHLNAAYLTWLYANNPDGEVVGFDAFDGDRLAAHYACIPVRLCMFGKECTGLLSLNTATHPDYQGKGLFTQLANRTYDRGASLGHHGVYGIANANSTPGFTKKLGFALVSPLEARIGLGAPASIDWDDAIEKAQFRRLWDDKRIQWRCQNPANPARITTRSGNAIEVKATTDKPMISAWANVHGDFNSIGTSEGAYQPGTLFLGLLPMGAHRFRLAMNIPQRLRPSPLNFIYRPLQTASESLDPTNIICSFVDFDAY